MGISDSCDARRDVRHAPPDTADEMSVGMREWLRHKIMGRTCVFAIPFADVAEGATAGSRPAGEPKIYCGLKGGLCVLPGECDEPERADPGFGK